MFIKEDVVKAIRIHKLGYKFLMYIRNKLDSNELGLSRVHDGTAPAEAVLNWISDYYDYLPKSILPDREELKEFSNYFASYLTTSFKLSEKPERVNNKLNGCFCDICLQLVNVSHLKSISPNKHDRKIAQEKRIEIVKELALSQEINLTNLECENIANSKFTLKKAAYLAYTKALLKRIQCSEGGIYILALWRQFAWTVKGSPIKNFEFLAADVLNAEQSLIYEIKYKK